MVQHEREEDHHHCRSQRCGKDNVSLFFLMVPDVEVAIARVAQRVRQGGHNIPEAVIRRRFDAGLRNLDLYKAVVDSWAVFDNVGKEPTFIDWDENS